MLHIIQSPVVAFTDIDSQPIQTTMYIKLPASASFSRRHNINFLGCFFLQAKEFLIAAPVRSRSVELIRFDCLTILYKFKTVRPKQHPFVIIIRICTDWIITISILPVSIFTGMWLHLHITFGTGIMSSICPAYGLISWYPSVLIHKQQMFGISIVEPPPLEPLTRIVPSSCLIYHVDTKYFTKTRHSIVPFIHLLISISILVLW